MHEEKKVSINFDGVVALAGKLLKNMTKVIETITKSIKENTWLAPASTITGAISAIYSIVTAVNVTVPTVITGVGIGLSVAIFILVATTWDITDVLKEASDVVDNIEKQVKATTCIKKVVG